jgi:hypothetical protein
MASIPTALHALQLAEGRLSAARQFLLTGTRGVAIAVPSLAVDYTDFPLLYLVHAIADAFLALPDRC